MVATRFRSLTSRLTRGLGLALALWACVCTAHAQSFIRDAEIENFIRGELDPLIEAAGLNPSSVGLYLINDSSPNAFVTGGQNVFVHTGMILLSEELSMMNGVLAHEVAHISGGHLSRRREVMGQATTPMLLGLLLGAAAIAAGAPEGGIAALGLSQQAAMDQVLSYTRSQEASADQAAVTFLERTGQTSRGLLEFFQEFRYQEALSNARRFEYFRTHPLSSDRIAFLEERVSKTDHFGAEPSEEKVHDFEMIKAKIRGFLEKPEFTFRHYGYQNDSQPARYARAIATYRVPETEKALAMIDELIAEEPENPYFHELKGQALFESGRSAEAVEAHSKAVDIAPDEALLQINLARALVAVGDPQSLKRAEAALDKAQQSERGNPWLWRLRAQIHGKRGDEGLAQLATAEQYFATGQIRPARQFAGRARAKLERGSVSWQRATDILIAGLPSEEVEEATRQSDRLRDQQLRAPR